MPNLISRAIDSIYQVFRGLGTVGGHTFKEPITEQYPDYAPNLPAHFRGRLALQVNPESGEHLCISCRQCERVCPDKCIEITAHKSPETNKLELIDFKIDHGLCMFCGLCTEVCPTSCIINTNDFEMADYTRESLVYDLKKLTLSQEESAYYFDKKETPLPKPKPAKPAPAAAGAAAAAKPAPAAGAAPAAAAAAKPAADAAAKPAADAAKPAADAAKPAAEAAKPAAEAAKPAEEAKPAEAKAEEAKPAEKAEAKPTEEAKPAEAKTEEAKPEAKADEAKSEDKPKES
ncbi:MAG TPA: NADH-quinone oxidoreductase subunit I [Drouetiella sp.]